MSTKINVRSPFYISYEPPVAVTPVFDKTQANPTGFQIDDNGNISIPVLDYGIIEDITSEDADFVNDKFATETSDTNRTIVIHIRVPEGFSNSGDLVSMEVDALQPATIADCATVVTADGVSVGVSLDTGGNSANVDLSARFSGTGTIDDYIVTNLHPSFFDTIITSAGVLTVTSKSQAGTYFATVSALDNDTGCRAHKSVTITLNSVLTFGTNDAAISGGEIKPDGTIISPSVVGSISTIRFSPTGSGQSAFYANDTGSSRSVTLYFDITVPQGYSNAGATVQVSQTFTQEAENVVPEFLLTGDDAWRLDVDDESILSNGQVIAGTAEYSYQGNNYPVTIQSVTPTSFDTVTSSIKRDITYTLVIPSGFQNAGQTITYTKQIRQAATDVEPVNPCAGYAYSLYIGNNILADGSVADQNNFDYPSLAHAPQFLAYAPVQDFINFDGKKICINGNILASARGGLIYINDYNTKGVTVQQDPVEYLIRFGDNNTIDAMWRKNWNTRTSTRIF